MKAAMAGDRINNYSQREREEVRMRRHLRRVVVLSVLALSWVAWVDAMPNAQPSTDVWASVQGLPPGTRVTLTFTDGAEVTGTVVDTTADAVVINDYRTGRTGIKTSVGSSPRGTLTFTRSGLATVAVLKVPTRYNAGGAPNVAVVRYVVTALGIGKKIDLKTTRAMRSRRGTIRSIEQDGFRVVQGFRAPADFVAYSDVDQVRAAGLPGVLKGTLLISTGYFLVFLVFVAQADWG